MAVLVLYRGDYAYYLEKKEEEAELARQLAISEAKAAKTAANREKQQARAADRKEKGKAA